MKQTLRIHIGALTALFVAASLSVLQGETIVYKARPGGQMKMQGSSTVHDWEVVSRIIGGTMEITSDFPLNSDLENPEIKAVPKVAVMIPVTSLKSGKKKMDEVMRDAMNYPKAKTILYKLEKMTLSKDPRKADDPLKFDTEGKLTVAGVTKPVKFPVKIQTSDGSRIMVTGKTKMKMTDFDIKPPAPKVALGLIKTDDEVTLSWNWFLARQDKKK